MIKNKKVNSRLNNSNLSKKLSLFLCLLFFLSSNLISTFNPSYSQDTKDSKKEGLNVTVTPNPAKQGDPVVVKILKDPETKGLPKVFFDKTKYPVFKLSDTYFRTIIPLTANQKTGRYQIEVFYGRDVERIDLPVNETKYPLQELTLSKQVAGLMASRIERDLVNKALGSQSEKKLWSGRFINPSSAAQSTAYGVKRRVNGVINPDYFHKGLDFAGKEGSNILAPEDGVVVLAGLNSKGFVVNGNCVFIDHGHSVVSGYLHLSKILVKEGDFVKKGQVIGKVGSTGIASGPHLHWGIYVSGKTVDPICWTSMAVE